MEYQYRLTITFASASEWKLGVHTLQIGEAVARELCKNAGDVYSVCLSLEKTGKVKWLKQAKAFQN